MHSPLKGLFSKEVALLQGANVFFLDGVRLLDGHFHLFDQNAPVKQKIIQDRKSLISCLRFLC